jgi:hypothetical protein
MNSTSLQSGVFLFEGLYKTLHVFTNFDKMGIWRAVIL